MPNPGDQYNSETIKNPFEEERVSNFTAQEIATLQSRLNKQLGPEYISSRQGGGGKVAYLEGNKAIALANEVFGFNGWSSSLRTVQIDFVDENPTNGKITLGLSITVRVTLKDGTYHEDIGYGCIENCKGKAAAFEKAKKEAATDGLKRALRTFGNVLGNCLYDKEYLKKVNNMKALPIKFKEEALYRHPDFAPRSPVKEDKEVVKKEVGRTPARTNQVMRTRTEAVGLAASDFDDEFGGNLFDGVEISENQGDEFTFDSIPEVEGPAPKLLEAPPKASEISNGIPSKGNGQGHSAGPPRPTPRMQSMPPMRPQNGANPSPQQQNQPHPGPQRPPAQASNARAPQTPIPQANNVRPDFNRGRVVPPATDTHAPPTPQHRPQPAHQNGHPPSHNPPLRQTPPQPPQSNTNAPNPAPQTRPTAQNNHTAPIAPPTTHRPPMGFITSRAAELVQNTDSTSSIPPNLPAFNPHADSPVPKEQRTPGIDHTRSMKITREQIGAPNPPPPPPQLANLPPARSALGRPNNFVNPHQDMNRRIGMPGAGAQSPLANRSAYKPPGIVGVKRPPLADVSNRDSGGAAEEPEGKRQKTEGAGVGGENVAGGAVVST